MQLPLIGARVETPAVPHLTDVFEFDTNKREVILEEKILVCTRIPEALFDLLVLNSAGTPDLAVETATEQPKKIGQVARRLVSQQSSFVCKSTDSGNSHLVRTETGYELHFSPQDWKTVEDLLEQNRTRWIRTWKRQIEDDPSFWVTNLRSGRIAKRVGNALVNTVLTELTEHENTRRLTVQPANIEEMRFLLAHSGTSAAAIDLTLREYSEPFPVVQVRFSPHQTVPLKSEGADLFCKVGKDDFVSLGNYFKSPKKVSPIESKASTEAETQPLNIETSSVRNAVFALVVVASPALERLNQAKALIVDLVRSSTERGLKASTDIKTQFETDPNTKILKSLSRESEVAIIRAALIKKVNWRQITPADLKLIIALLKKSDLSDGEEFDLFFTETIAPLLITACKDSQGVILLQRVDALASILPDPFKPIFSALVTPPST